MYIIEIFALTLLLFLSLFGIVWLTLIIIYLSQCAYNGIKTILEANR